MAELGANCRRKGGCAGPGSKVDAPEVSSGPEWKIQGVSRVSAQRVTSKSKLLAREMPDLHTGGLRVDSGAARGCGGLRVDSGVLPREAVRGLVAQVLNLDAADAATRG